MDLPQTIELTPRDGLIVYGVLHFLYAFVTHYRTLHISKQALRRAKELADTNHENSKNLSMSYASISLNLAYLLLVGLEAKIAEMLAFVGLRVARMVLFFEKDKPFNLSWTGNKYRFIRCLHSSFDSRFGTRMVSGKYQKVFPGRSKD